MQGGRSPGPPSGPALPAPHAAPTWACPPQPSSCRPRPPADISLSSHRSRVYLMWKLRQGKFPKVCGPPGPREGALTSALQQNRLPPPSPYLESTHLSPITRPHQPGADPAHSAPSPQLPPEGASRHPSQVGGHSRPGSHLGVEPKSSRRSLRPCTPAPAPPCPRPLPLPWLALCPHGLLAAPPTGQARCCPRAFVQALLSRPLHPWGLAQSLDHSRGSRNQAEQGTPEQHHPRQGHHPTFSGEHRPRPQKVKMGSRDVD